MKAERQPTAPPPAPPPPDPDERPHDLISTNKAAKLVNRHPAVICRWVLKGYIRGWKVQNRWLVSRAEIIAQIKEYHSRQIPPAPRRSTVNRQTRETLARFGLTVPDAPNGKPAA